MRAIVTFRPRASVGAALVLMHIRAQERHAGSAVGAGEQEQRQAEVRRRRKLGESSPLGRCYAVSIICSIIRTRTPLECVVLARQPGEAHGRSTAETEAEAEVEAETETEAGAKAGAGAKAEAEAGGDAEAGGEARAEVPCAPTCGRRARCTSCARPACRRPPSPARSRRSTASRLPGRVRDRPSVILGSGSGLGSGLGLGTGTVVRARVRVRAAASCLPPPPRTRRRCGARRPACGQHSTVQMAGRVQGARGRLKRALLSGSCCTPAECAPRQLQPAREWPR